MTKDVHLEALKAAARVAFSVAFLGVAGCAAENADDEASNGDGPEAAESDLKGGTTAKKKPKSTASTSPTATAPCHADAGAKPPLSCDQVLASAFPTPSNYPGTKKSISTDVTSCCEKELLSDEGLGMSKYRWDCCANIAWKDEKIGIACTPWGPPVPPSMKRRAKRPIPSGLDPWIMQGVA